MPEARELFPDELTAKPRFLCLLSCTPNNCRIAPLKLVSWDTRKLADLSARPLPDRPEP